MLRSTYDTSAGEAAHAGNLEAGNSRRGDQAGDGELDQRGGTHVDLRWLPGSECNKIQEKKKGVKGSTMKCKTRAKKGTKLFDQREAQDGKKEKRRLVGGLQFERV